MNALGKFTLVAALLGGTVCLAQSDVSAPPMVPSGTNTALPPPPPPPDPGQSATPPPPTVAQPGTPPPPSAMPPSGYTPGGPGTGYPYSPYGAQPFKPNEKPPMEVGLMIEESLFGMLTAAGVTLIPYFLLFDNGSVSLGDSTVSSIIFLVIFAAVPLATAQTEVSLANGSRYYYSETWPSALIGLAGEAAVLGLYYLTGWLPNESASVSGGVPSNGGGSAALLLIGSIAVVPLLQVAAINLFKSPRVARWGGLLNFDNDHGLAVGVPGTSPVIGQTAYGKEMGVQFSLVNFHW